MKGFFTYLLLAVSLCLPAQSLFSHPETTTALTESKSIPTNVSRVYLKNGENISGKIIRINDDTITLESDKNYGILTIPKRDIISIEFTHTLVKLNRRYGIGYISKTNLISDKSSADFNVNMISLKTYFSDDNFALQWMAGAGYTKIASKEYNIICPDNTAACDVERTYQIFKAGLRGSFTMHKQQNAILYYGLGGGVISLKNIEKASDEDVSRENTSEGTGGFYSLFLGSEIFFNSLPNFGFAGEVSLDGIFAEDFNNTQVYVSPFPIFSVHYYF